MTDIRYRNEDETNDNDNIVEETDTYTDISNLNVVRPSYIDTRGLYVTRCNNLIIRNNTIHHTPGGGLRVAESSYVDIIGNEIYRCSAKSYSGTHALVVTKTEPIGSDDYSVKILKNTIHHNYNEQFSWAPDKTIITPRIDEGKGISLQRNNTSNWINGSGRILVENNLCYWNGFSGVHTNDGYRIDFINNTCYLNSFTNTITYPNEFPAEGQQGNNIGISAQSSNDVKMINNIAVIDTDWNGFALSAGGTSNLVVSDNMIFGYNGSLSQDVDISSLDVNTTIADPLFVNTNTFEFNLQPSSPAIGIANSSFAPSDDFYSFTRDANPDLGAIEYNPSLSSTDLASIEVAVFPNPFKDKIQVTTSNSVEDIRLFSVSGQQINISNQITGNNTGYTISTLNLAAGLYILKLDSEKFKVIKQ
jgi:parallel beta-helix repeat protein